MLRSSTATIVFAHDDGALFVLLCSFIPVNWTRTNPALESPSSNELDRQPQDR